MFPVRPLAPLRHGGAAARGTCRCSPRRTAASPRSPSPSRTPARTSRRCATTARRDGDDVVLTGEKCYVTNGGIAELTSSSRSSRAAISAFLVEAGRPGCHRRAARRRSSACAPRTPARSCSTTRASRPTGCSARTGEGFAVAMDFFEHSRPQVAAGAVGVARAAFEYATEYAREREAFGKPILAQAGRLVQARRHGDGDRGGAAARRGARARRVDAGEDAGLLGSYAKAFAADAAMRATTEAVQILGGAGSHARPPGREVAPRREGLPDRRGHVRDPAARDLDVPPARRWLTPVVSPRALPGRADRRPHARPPAAERDRRADGHRARRGDRRARPPTGETRAVLVRSALEGVFMAGADIHEFERVAEEGRPRAARAGGVQPASPSCRSRRSPRSTATRSAAGSSSRSPATSASAARTDGALIGLPEVRLGLLPGAGGHAAADPARRPGRRDRADHEGAPALARAGGRRRDRPLPGRAGRARARRSRDYAVRLARQAPIALRGIKRAIRAAQSPDGLAVEGEAFREVLASEDAQTGVAAFLEGERADLFGRSKHGRLRRYTLRLAPRGGSHPFARTTCAAGGRRALAASGGSRSPPSLAAGRWSWSWSRSSTRAPRPRCATGSRSTASTSAACRPRRRRRTLQQRARARRSRSPSQFVAAGHTFQRLGRRDLGLTARLGRRGRRRPSAGRRLRAAARLPAASSCASSAATSCRDAAYDPRR